MNSTRTLTLIHKGTPEQRAFWNSHAKYRAFVGGIGSGKTRAGCVEILRQPAGSIGMVVAPSYPMLRDATRATFLWLARRATVLQDFNVSANIATLIDGKQVTFRSADNPDSLRGPNLDWFYMDEAAMCHEDAWLIMIGRLRGSGNVIKNALKGWLTTTPRGRNWVWKIFGQGTTADHEMIRASTRTNTFLPGDFVRNIEAAYSEKWRAQELGGEFIESDGSFLRNVQACAIAQPQTGALAGHAYVMGIDWARASGGDYTVFIVVDATSRRMAAMVRLNGMDYNSQVSRLKTLWRQFNHCPIIAEYNSMGGPLVERLQAEGINVTGFTTTAASKHEIITGLDLAFDQKSIAILDDPVLIGELQAYEKHDRAGIPGYSAPEGMHDDTVMALAIAWSGVNEQKWGNL